MAQISDTLRQETANYIREVGASCTTDQALLGALATRLCGTATARPWTLAKELARYVEPSDADKPSQVLVDIFDLPNDAIVALTGEQLKKLYETGVVRGAYDEPRANKLKCKVNCEVLSCGTTNAMG